MINDETIGIRQILAVQGVYENRANIVGRGAILISPVFPIPAIGLSLTSSAMAYYAESDAGKRDPDVFAGPVISITTTVVAKLVPELAFLMIVIENFNTANAAIQIIEPLNIDPEQQ